MKNPLFTGACTALVTPLLNNLVNYPMLEQLLRRQMDAGIHTVVISGTTGEAPTLSDSEKLEMIHRSKQFVGDDCCIIAGTGSNSTEHSILLSQCAEKAGADALLIVSPYYNKSTPEGVYLHYCAIAEAVHIPIIVYNVPSRTGMDVPVSVYRRLAQIPNIVGVKEASSDITKISRIRAECPDSFSIWGGNDDQAVPLLSLGGKGLISVVSNLFPEKVQAMVCAALDGDFDTAAALQIELQPIVSLLFSEVNPIPVKAAMQLIGYDCGECRLPLTAPSDQLLAKMMCLLKNT